MSQSTPRAIVRRIRGLPASDGAGVRLTRVLGTPQCDYLDPFLMLDEFRNERADDYMAGFPSHPHRGFETVTYMMAGLMRHEDSEGNAGTLGPGSVQWMTAGRGIVHSEMPEQQEGLLWGYQLWVNLPASRKMTAPRYQDIPAERIPEVVADGVRVRVIAGSHDGTAGAVDSLTAITYLDVALDAGARFATDVPEGDNAFAFVMEGGIAGRDPLGRDAPLARGEMGVLTQSGRVELSASASGGRFLLVAGRPLDEPVARYGPFVMNTREEIMQAAQDYQSGRFTA